MHLLRAVKSTIGFILEAFPYLHSVGAISYYNILFICLGKKITPMIEAIGVCRPYECFSTANIRQFIEMKNHKRMFFSTKKSRL